MMKAHNSLHRLAARRGFSLVEILLSLGILSVGLTMVAALFPAGMFLSKKSQELTMGSLVADNGRAVAMAKLRHTTCDAKLGKTLAVVPVGQDSSDLLSSFDVAYRIVPEVKPEDDDEMDYKGTTWSRAEEWKTRRYGWLLLGSQPKDGVNDYQFAVIPYQLFAGYDYFANGMPEPVLCKVTVATDGDLASSFQKPDLAALNSPVIDVATGRYAIVTKVAVDGDGKPTGRVDLSGDMGFTSSKTIEAWVLPGVNRGAKSPAIGCLTFRTSLSP